MNSKANSNKEKSNIIYLLPIIIIMILYDIVLLLISYAGFISESIEFTIFPVILLIMSILIEVKLIKNELGEPNDE